MNNRQELLDIPIILTTAFPIGTMTHPIFRIRTAMLRQQRF